MNTMHPKPPRLAKALLKRFCRIEFLEEIEGDLDEHFNQRCLKRGKLQARLGYWRDVLYSIMTTSTSRRENRSTHSAAFIDLLKHFIKVSIRQLQRSRSTTIINITGLSVSIACFLFILIYLIKESSYDSMHPDADNVYRVSRSLRPFDEGDEHDARIPGLWTVSLKEALPEITAYTRFSRFGYPGMVRYEKRNLINVEQQFFWTDSTYTDIFSLPMIEGEMPADILRDPSKVIINETMAAKYFGSEEPVGETIIYERDGLDIPLVVAGVMKNYPSNTHFHPDFIASNLALAPLWQQDGEINSSYTSGGVDRINSWWDAFTYSYIKLRPGTQLNKVDRVMRDILKAHLKDEAKSLGWPTITRLTDIHFTQGFLIELETPGESIYLYLFGTIGVLILLVACINYMNIATAKSLQRSKEVGLRKALGIKRVGLIVQFVGESTVITAISTALALVLIIIFLPGYNDVSAQWITLQEILTSKIWILLFGLVLVVGIVAGSYPAFYLSAFKPLDVLRGKLKTDGGAERLRKSLVVFQFTITLLLVVGTLVVRNQLAFINETKLSEFKEQVLTVRLFGIAHPRNIESFTNIIRRQSFVENVSMGSTIPRQESYGWIDIRIKAPELDKTFETWKHLDMDVNFASLFNLEFIAGRNFSARNSNDTSKLIINEAAVKNLGIMPDRAIGLVLEDAFTHMRKEVIGVVRDFNYSSVRHQIEPLVVSAKAENAETMYIKLNGGKIKEGIEVMEENWKNILPNSPFEYSFLDKEFDRMYRQEISTGALLSYFSGLTIIIGCLGLLGLASYTVEQKSKEIGVRKVLGASGLQILMMMTSRFVKLTMLAVLIGTPLAYYLVANWLNRFAYKADIHWSVFVFSGIFLLLVTYVTVAVESTRAALQNPVKSLRHE